MAAILLATAIGSPAYPQSSGLETIRPGVLTWGADQEGGGPFVIPSADEPGVLEGFEVDLIAALAGEIGLVPRFQQGQWDHLLENLRRGDMDVVINGYEWSPDRAESFLATRPYYLYELQVIAREADGFASWSDVLERGRGGGRRPRVAVLAGSMAERFARKAGDRVEVITLPGTIEALRGLEQGRFEATVQDLPAARFYRPEFPDLALVGPPMERGEYVLYIRPGHEALRDAIDRAILALGDSGELRRIYEHWDIWTDTQAALTRWTPSDRGPRETPSRPPGWTLVGWFLPDLLRAAGMTIMLAVASMPPAMAMGLCLALARLYGPKPVRWLAVGIIELIRGTPLLLQLFVLYYLLPEMGILIPRILAGVVGLAINYSAYEAEIYRAGLQAIPRGQMEAALALGMSRGLALRRVIVPQAFRLVIPPVTSDFIALFKDTSVCSVIAITELTKQYTILGNTYPDVVQFAVAAAALYLAMSIPLSWLSGRIERSWGVGALKAGRGQ